MPKKSRKLPQKKKVPLSRCLPPDSGCGRINAPHGGRYYIALSTGHKKGQSGKGWRTFRRLNQMVDDANIGIVFGSATKKAEVFLLPPAIYYYIMESIYLSYNSNVTSSPHLSHLRLQKFNMSDSDKKAKANTIDLLLL